MWLFINLSSMPTEHTECWQLLIWFDNKWFQPTAFTPHTQLPTHYSTFPYQLLPLYLDNKYFHDKAKNLL